MPEHSKHKIKDFLQTIIIVSGLLYLIAVSILTVIFTFKAEDTIGEQIPIIVELRDNSDKADILRLEQLISKSDYCFPKSVKFISKDEAANKISYELTKEELEIFDKNLLADIIEFQIKSKYSGKTNKIISDLKKQAPVAEVISNKKLEANFNYNLQRIRLIAYLLLIFFIFVAISVICKSYRLYLLSNGNTQKNNSAAELFKNNIKTALFSGFSCVAGLMITFVIVEKQLESTVFSVNYISLFAVSAVVFILGILLFAAGAKIISIKNIKSK